MASTPQLVFWKVLFLLGCFYFKKAYFYWYSFSIISPKHHCCRHPSLPSSFTSKKARVSPHLLYTHTSSINHEATQPRNNTQRWKAQRWKAQRWSKNPVSKYVIRSFSCQFYFRWQILLEVWLYLRFISMCAFLFLGYASNRIFCGGLIYWFHFHCFSISVELRLYCWSQFVQKQTAPQYWHPRKGGASCFCVRIPKLKPENP